MRRRNRRFALEFLEDRLSLSGLAEGLVPAADVGGTGGGSGPIDPAPGTGLPPIIPLEPTTGPSGPA